jgi:hypothetical protein
MSKGGHNSILTGGDSEMTTKEVARLIEWLKQYGMKHKAIDELINYLATGDNKHLPKSNYTNGK